MRRVLLMLLVVLLPFNGWAGVASLRCLHEAAGGAAVRGGHAGHAGHAGHSGHAGHGDHGDHGDHTDHADHDPAHSAALTHADPAAQSDATASATGEVDCAHADCGGCCHASGSVAVGLARLPAVGAVLGGVLATFADASPDSPALDGPFRPPRTASA
jgi:hypothetical protein